MKKWLMMQLIPLLMLQKMHLMPLLALEKKLSIVETALRMLLNATQLSKAPLRIFIRRPKTLPIMHTLKLNAVQLLESLDKLTFRLQILPNNCNTCENILSREERETMSSCILKFKFNIFRLKSTYL